MNDQSLWNLWDTIKRQSKHHWGLRKEEKKPKDKMADSFPKVGKDLIFKFIRLSPQNFNLKFWSPQPL